MNIIYWQDLREGYNFQYRKSENQCKTINTMLRNVYKRYKTIERAAEVLGISQNALWRKMVKEGITRQPKGWRGVNRCLDMIQYVTRTRPIEEFSYQELAKEIKFSVSYVKNVCRKNGLKCKNGRRNRSSNPGDFLTEEG